MLLREIYMHKNKTSECFLKVNCISTAKGVTNKLHSSMEIHRERRKIIATADRS